MLEVAGANDTSCLKELRTGMAVSMVRM